MYEGLERVDRVGSTFGLYSIQSRKQSAGFGLGKTRTFPTLGCTGISPRCLPNFVKLSSSFSAPMFCRSVTACTMACGTGGSGACARNAAVDPAPLPTVAATPVCSLPREETSANIRTCKQSSSSGDRCISGSWKSANAAILLDE